MDEIRSAGYSVFHFFEKPLPRTRAQVAAAAPPQALIAWAVTSLPSPVALTTRTNSAIGWYYATKPETLVRWYFCPPGAKKIAFAQPWGTRDWDSIPEKCENQYGEVPFIPRKWDAGFPPRGVTGQHFCGNEEAWNTIGPWNRDDPGLRRGAFGVPICCNPAVGNAIGWQIPNIPQGAIVWQVTPQTYCKISAGVEVQAAGPLEGCGWFNNEFTLDEPLIDPSGHGVDMDSSTSGNAFPVIASQFLVGRVEAQLDVVAADPVALIGMFVCVYEGLIPAKGFILSLDDNTFYLDGGTGPSYLGIDQVDVGDMTGHTIQFTLIIDRVAPSVSAIMVDVTGGLTYTLSGDAYFSAPWDGDLSGMLSGLLGALGSEAVWTKFTVLDQFGHLAVLDNFNDTPGRGLYEHTPDFQQGCTPPLTTAATIHAGVELVAAGSHPSPATAVIDAGVELVAAGSHPSPATAVIDAGVELVAAGSHPVPGSAVIDAGAQILATG